MASLKVSPKPTPRTFVMVNLATQEDILSVRQDLANAKQELCKPP
jgi:hypothetical protein